MLQRIIRSSSRTFTIAPVVRRSGPRRFLDTGYAVALLSPRDQYHAVAKRRGVDLKGGGHKVVTTDAIVLELGAALTRVADRGATPTFIDGLRADPKVEIVEFGVISSNQAAGGNNHDRRTRNISRRTHHYRS